MTLSCSVCNHTLNSSPIIEFGNIPLCDKYTKSKTNATNAKQYPINIMQCPNCQHSELDIKAPEEEIYTHYNYFSSNSTDLNSHFHDYVTWFKEHLNLKEGATHLDAGCNDGLLLDNSRAQGFNTMGLDPSPAAMNALEKGHNVHQTYITEQCVETFHLYECADVVTCNSVIANVRDLKGFVQAIYSMVKQEGYFIVETLNFATIVDKHVYEMINHEHYHYFSTTSMMTLLQSAGFQLVEIFPSKTKGANMRCVAKKTAKPTNPEISDQLTTHEKQVNLATFKERIVDIAQQLQTHIENYKENNHSVIGFGAVGGTTILIYLYGLEKHITHIVDDNASRHHLYAPGTGAEVIGSDVYYRMKPELTVLFAWRFGEVFKERHNKHLPTNHQFLSTNTSKFLE